MSARLKDIDLKANFLKDGAQPPPRRSGNREKYNILLDELKKAKGVWAVVASVKKGDPTGVLYSRRQTIGSFEGFTAQVRGLGADVSRYPGVPKEHAFGTGLFAVAGSLPKAAKAAK